MAMTPSEQGGFRYAAFISYRHLPRDTEVAKRVQRALEEYRLPKGVCCTGDSKSITPARMSGRKLGKCFRDEDELAASYSLSSPIREALAESRVLIVICTPETAASQWVLREIREFTQLHGRERIVAVLASGSSDESIPDILKTPETFHIDGEEVKGTASPLAADLRSSATSKPQDEMLRVIAAVAGCDYDDLKQRQQRRQKKRIALASVAALVLAATIAALAFWMFSTSGERLAAQSREMAAESRQQLQSGDRMAAIQTALAALPSSSTDESRPLVTEAQVALEDALQVNPDTEGNLWRPSYALPLSDGVAAFTTSPSGNWAAFMDDTRKVQVFELETGTFLQGFSLDDYWLPVADSLDAQASLADEWTILAVGEDNLVIASRTGNGSFICFDARSGQLKWEHKKTPTASLAISEDGTQIVHFAILEDDAMLAAVIDVNTGETLEWRELENSGFGGWTIFLPSAYDAEAGKAYLGAASYLIQFDFAGDATDILRIDDNMVQSVLGSYDVALVTSAYPDEADRFARKMSLSAVTDETVVWTAEGSYSVDVRGNAYDSSVVEALPKVVGFALGDGLAVIVTAGNQVNAYSFLEGRLLDSCSFASSIVGASTQLYTDEKTVVAVAAAEGMLDMWFPFSDSPTGAVFRTVVPYEIDEAAIKRCSDGNLLAILDCTDASGKVLVYRYDEQQYQSLFDGSPSEDEPRKASLDELIDTAREILAANRGESGLDEDQKSLVHNPII